MGKYLNEKRKCVMVPKPRMPEKHTNEESQTKKKDPTRCKSAQCYNKRFVYKTTECLEQHDSLHHSQHGKEKVKQHKERNYRAIFKKREHRCWNNRIYLNGYRVVNEDTSRNPVCVEENRIIYNSIYNFKEDMPTKKIVDLLEMRIVCKEEQCNRYELLMEDCLEIHKIFHGDQQFKNIAAVR